MNEIITIVILIIMLAIQYFLSSSTNKYLGLIIPIVFSGFVIFMLVTDRLGIITSLVLLVLGLIFLLEQWYKGQKNNKRKMNKELTKMKSKDL
ncbi:hypothetical protein B4W75_12630 [Staphylococcus intermedius]|uniref:Membrane protein n=2 Tax=Staphylococcus intermedius TaxID=1285 RepID=A0A380G1D7_STAIN|nr:hypothetical protein B4W76_12295 [Staphylococcus intermedius]PCF85030.1 hypothetical protein B4W75_12630 [Staphylococcus intermedius]PNZ49714.1 hypothetical protein CD138_12600 [Staphylococcus intermedius NCTC 11048]SUM43831.1 membrane protein [Staphylococcus intermedius NCTC 11048]